MADQNQMMDLAKAMGGGAAAGAGMGAITGAIPNGLPGAMAGMQSGALSGAAVPLMRRMFPNNPDAGQLIGQGLLMPQPLGLPAIVGGGLMGLFNAKPTPTAQLGSEPSYP